MRVHNEILNSLSLLLVVFTAMLDPIISFVLSIVLLLVMALCGSGCEQDGVGQTN
jgi:hypothetical protein